MSTVQSEMLEHSSNHGVVMSADSSFYMDSSSSLSLKGGPVSGTIVDARNTRGCRDDWKAFGCKST